MKFAKNTLTKFPRIRRNLKIVYALLRGQSPHISDVINKYIRVQNPVILDIGCNDGKEVKWFLEAFKNPRIYCFEPDPRAAGRFKNKFGKQPNVRLFETAISDRNGEITFYQSDGQPEDAEFKASSQGWDYSGSIRKPKNHLEVHPWVTFEHTITVPTMTLDTWCKEQGLESETIHLIWMDVQGAEIDVFRGGKSALSRTQFIYTEYDNNELYEGQASLKELLAQLPAFAVVRDYNGNVLLQNTQFHSKLAR